MDVEPFFDHILLVVMFGVYVCMLVAHSTSYSRITSYNVLTSYTSYND